MALLNATLIGSPRLSVQTLVARVQAAVVALKQAVRRRAVYKQTVRELNTLTAREMTDLGIHPAMIHDVARAAAYGK